MGKIKKLKKEIELLKEIRDLYLEIEEIKAKEWNRVFTYPPSITYPPTFTYPPYFTTSSTTNPIFTTNTDNTAKVSHNQW